VGWFVVVVGRTNTTNETVHREKVHLGVITSTITGPQPKTCKQKNARGFIWIVLLSGVAVGQWYSVRIQWRCLG